MIIQITAIASVTSLCAIALLKGMDTVVLSLGLSIISGIAGYEVGKRQTAENKN